MDTNEKKFYVKKLVDFGFSIDQVESLCDDDLLKVCDLINNGSL